jgi:hypothetical protein
MDNTFTVVEEISTLRNASYFLNNATRIFIENNNQIGTYNDEIARRFEDGLAFIHELMDGEYKKVQDRLAKEVQNAN